MPPQGRRPSLDDLYTAQQTTGRGAGTGPSRPSLDDLYDAPDTPSPEEPSTLARFGAGAARVGLPLLGGLIGSVVPGWGTAIGGVGGGLLGETIAQSLEGRKEYGKLSIATQGALGAIPGLKTLGVVGKLGLAGAQNAAGSVAESWDREGLSFDEAGLDRTLQAAKTGGTIGVLTGGLLHGAPKAIRGLRARATAPKAPPESGIPQTPEWSTDPEDWKHVPAPDTSMAAPASVSRARAPRIGDRTALGDMAEAPTTRSTRQAVVQDPFAAPRRTRGAQTPLFDEGMTLRPGATPEPFDAGPGWGQRDAPAPGVEQPTLSFLDLDAAPTRVNGSGDSSASLEAMSRLAGEKSRGETRVMYDRAGNRRVIAPTVDGVDVFPRPGETLVMEGPDGVRVLEDNGGRVPTPGTSGTVQAPPSAPETPGFLQLDADSPVDLDAALGEATGAPAGPKPRIPASITAQFLKHGAGDGAGLEGGTDNSLYGYYQRLATTAQEVQKHRAAGDMKAAKAAGRKLMWGDRTAMLGALDEGNPLTPLPDQAPISSPANTTAPGWFGSDAGGGLGGDEGGFIDPELARRAGTSVLSGFGTGTAAALYGDEENRGRNFAGGFAIGVGAPRLLSSTPGAGKAAMDALSRYRYFSMLSSLGAQGSNLAGGVGASAVRAAEDALSGRPDRAKAILGAYFNPKTWEVGVRAFESPAAEAFGDTRWGQTQGFLGLPSRFMHAADMAATDALERGGLSTDEAKLSLFTSAPRSRAGQTLSELPQSLSALVPFARTAANITERGLEYTPILNRLPGVRVMRPDTTPEQEWARTLLGAGALGLGASGYLPDSNLAKAFLGPLALPAMIGDAARTAHDRRGDGVKNQAAAVSRAVLEGLPLPTDPYALDPGRFLASFVPGALQHVTPAPEGFRYDTSGSLFDPAIAKIPFLNRELLPVKRKPRKRK